MQEKKTIIKRIVDICMTVLLLCLMAYQVTGEMLHEWIGIAMTLTVIIHQILNRKWYAALFKGKYNSIRVIMTIVNILLIICIVITAFCGMSMSGYAVPFLYGMAPAFIVRQLHLSISHWLFILMGIHLGLHIKMMFAKINISKKIAIVLQIVFVVIAGIGVWQFIDNNMIDYLLFKIPFAILDYEQSVGLVFVENITILILWVVVGILIMDILGRNRKVIDTALE